MCKQIKHPACPALDFEVETEPGRDVRILQLTDIQMIDPDQRAVPERLTPASVAFWDKSRLNPNYRDIVRSVIERVRPDLILFTGDLAYGEFDHSGTCFREVVGFLDGFGIPWAPVFGNHEKESARGVDWQCRQYEAAPHCLFKQRNLTGDGNYTVGLTTPDGKLLRTFVMLDTNGGILSPASAANGHSTTRHGLAADQIRWYEETVGKIRSSHPESRLTFAFHIQPAVFGRAFSQYGFRNAPETGAINLDAHPEKKETDFGVINSTLKSPWDGDGAVFESIRRTGADSVMVGHEHCASASVLYGGIRLQYGLKSSLYDRYNKVFGGEVRDGSVVSGTVRGDYYTTPDGRNLVGGTAWEISSTDGVIRNAHCVYAEA